MTEAEKEQLLAYHETDITSMNLSELEDYMRLLRKQQAELEEFILSH